MTPYRTAPAIQKAPRSSWWRRFTSRGLTRRLDIRRRRHALRARWPWVSWRERHEVAVAVSEGRWRAMWQAMEDEEDEAAIHLHTAVPSSTLFW